MINTELKKLVIKNLNFIIFFFFIAFLSLNSLNSSNIIDDSSNSILSEGSYYKGKIIVKFDRSMEKALECDFFKHQNNNYIKTGVVELDKLNKKYKANKYNKIIASLYDKSEASVNNKNLHREYGLHLWYEIKIDDNVSIEQAVSEYEKLRVIEIAEPSFKIHLNKPEKSKVFDNNKNDNNSKWSPNDPLYNQQWHLNNTGQTIGANPGIEGWDINVEAAWEIEKGNPDVIVAVIDVGMQFDHADLEGNMWEYIGMDSLETTKHFHGTHVGGIISAVSNNDLGVAGIAGGSGENDGVRLMALDISGGAFDILAAFLYAADNGVAITSNSWIIDQTTLPQMLTNAIEYFQKEGGGDALNGGISIFGAGNDSQERLRYPAAYETGIAVAAHNNRGEKSGISTYGNWVDITAPGSNITSADINNTYSAYTGTSLATPQVSGAAALLVSHFYGEFNNSHLRDILLRSARTDLYDHNPDYIGKLGYGALDILAAFEMAGNHILVDFVLEDVNGDSIKNALITIDGYNKQPGKYEFLLKDKGNKDINIKIQKYGFLTYEDVVTVDSDTTLNIVMEDAYNLTFQIFDEESNEIEDATITFNDKEYQQGEYNVKASEQRTYNFSIEREDYLILNDEIDVEGDTIIEIILQNAPVVLFEIENNQGEEIRNSIIVFGDEVIPQGIYEIRPQELGLYNFEIRNHGRYLTYRGEADIQQDTVINIVMEDPIIITFDIKDEFGEEITDAIVTFDNTEYDPGEYDIQVFDTGLYGVKVEKEGYITFTRTVRAEQDETIEIILIAEDSYINNVEDEIELSVYPNPASDKITVNSSEKIDKIKVLNITGVTTDYFEVYDYNKTLEFYNYSNGVFILQIEHSSGNIVNKRIQIIN